MRNIMKFAQLFFTAGLVLGAAASHAAPTQSRTMLPIGKKLVEALKNDHGYSDADVTRFVMILNRISVFADHQNPKSVDQDDYEKSKTFYMAPFFQPSPERSVVSSQMIADYALKIGESIDELVATFSFRLQELKRVAKKRSYYEGRIAMAESEISALEQQTPRDEAKIARLKELIKDYGQVIGSLTAKIDAMLAKGATAYKAMDVGLKQEIVGNILYNMGKLGVTPTAKQDKDLNSANAKVVLKAMAELRMAASRGQFAVRSVVMESGLTEIEMPVIALYRQLRPDVQIENIPTTKVYVSSAAQTVGYNGVVENGALLIRDVNRSSESKDRRGICGSLLTCTVTIEYTEAGAMTAVASQFDAINLPVTFAGDAEVSVPDFVGRFDCKFKNGWHAKGRSDVKDGAIIYDGDVYNRINYNDYSIEEYCKVEVSEGSKDSAQYSLLMEINDLYKKLFFERTIRNEREKKAYMKKVMAEIDAHAKKSQQKNGSYMSYVVSWAQGAMGGWQAAVAGIFSAARNFYWHTRIEDTKVESTVEVHKSFSFKNMVQTMEFAFDGYPVICHKFNKNTMQRVAVACSGSVRSKINNEADNHARVCSWQGVDDCREHIDNLVRTNDEGYLVL